MPSTSIVSTKALTWASRANPPIRTGAGANSPCATPMGMSGRSTRTSRAVSGQSDPHPNRQPHRAGQGSFLGLQDSGEQGRTTGQGGGLDPQRVDTELDGQPSGLV